MKFSDKIFFVTIKYYIATKYIYFVTIYKKIMITFGIENIFSSQLFVLKVGHQRKKWGMKLNWFMESLTFWQQIILLLLVFTLKAGTLSTLTLLLPSLSPPPPPHTHSLLSLFSPLCRCHYFPCSHWCHHSLGLLAKGITRWKWFRPQML